MDRDAARKTYLALANEQKSGRLSREAFLAEVEKLRYQDQDKNWLQVTEDGTCLRWDGNAWQATGVRIDSPYEASADAAPPPSPAAPTVKTESKAGRYLKDVLIRIPLVILTFFTTWVIHTYLLAGPNGGFGRGAAGSWVFSYWGNFIPSTVLWGLVSGLFWMLVFTYFKLGKKDFLPTLTRAPVMMIERIQQAGNPGIGAIIIGAGLALFFTPFSFITGNVGFAAALFLAIFGLSSFGWAIARFIARAWLWALKTFVKQHEEKYKINLAAAHMVMVGLIPGFIISLVLKGAFGFLSGIVLIVLGIYLFFDLKAPTFSGKTGLFVFGLATLAAQIAAMTCFPDWALAHNGGKAEAGGTWALWWGSQGYMRVLLHGIPPAIAAGIGALAPTLTPEKLVQIPPEVLDPKKYSLRSDITGGEVTINYEAIRLYTPVPRNVEFNELRDTVIKEFIKESASYDSEISLVDRGTLTDEEEFSLFKRDRVYWVDKYLERAKMLENAGKKAEWMADHAVYIGGFIPGLGPKFIIGYSALKGAAKGASEGAADIIWRGGERPKEGLKAKYLDAVYPDAPPEIRAINPLHNTTYILQSGLYGTIEGTAEGVFEVVSEKLIPIGKITKALPFKIPDFTFAGKAIEGSGVGAVITEPIQTVGKYFIDKVLGTSLSTTLDTEVGDAGVAVLGNCFDNVRDNVALRYCNLNINPSDVKLGGYDWPPSLLK